MAGSSSHRKFARSSTIMHHYPLLISDDDAPVPPPHPPPPLKNSYSSSRPTKGASVSTEPSKTKRSGQSSGGGGGVSAGDDDDLTDEEADEADRRHQHHHAGADVGDGIDDICPTCPGRCFCGRGSLRGPHGISRRGRSSLPGPVRIRLSRQSASLYGGSPASPASPPPPMLPLLGRSASSSLSELSSNGDETVPLDEDADDDDDDETVRGDEYERGGVSSEGEWDYGRSDAETTDDDETAVGKRLFGHMRETSMGGNEEGGAASVSGSDMYLEYTDFGVEGGMPVTWSEADDEGEDEPAHDATDEPEEFAELLLMDTDGEDSPFYLDNLDRIAHEDSVGYSSSDGSSGSSAGIWLIGNLDSTDMIESSSTASGPDEDEEMSDGATTDSLDEDDHSGLVKFGIEVDSDKDDAAFWDLPPDSDLGFLLADLAARGTVEFCVVEGGSEAGSLPPPSAGIDPSATTASPSSCPAAAPTTPASEAKLQHPTMGTFSAPGRGRTIISGRANSQSACTPSPFSGGKVVRYNRFRKLRDQAAEEKALRGADTAGSASLLSPGSSVKPTPNLHTLDLPCEAATRVSTEEEAFDITAFIRGISSKDVSDDDEADAESEDERGPMGLGALSRWSRVPMSAFRRSTMASPSSSFWADGADASSINGAMHPRQRRSSLSKTLSPLGSGRNAGESRRRKHQAALILASPVLGPARTGVKVKSRRERGASKKLLRKEAAAASAAAVGEGPKIVELGDGVEGSGSASAVGEGLGQPTMNGLLEAPSQHVAFKSFDTTLFHSVMGGGPDDVPMLDLDMVEMGCERGGGD